MADSVLIDVISSWNWKGKSREKKNTTHQNVFRHILVQKSQNNFPQFLEFFGRLEDVFLEVKINIAIP